MAPTSLLVHDGELADVCALMGQLGIEFSERRGPAKPEDEVRSWDLVVSTPRRLLELDLCIRGSRPVRIAILDKDSRTLRSMLHRAGIDLIVRRPVHPAALRLLILHSLYRGPEKRRAGRVSIGGLVRYRTGLRPRSGIMAELSESGCRLLSNHPLEHGRNLNLSIPAETAGGKGFRLTGTVVRTGDSEFPGVSASAIAFRPLPPKARDRLRAAIAAHASGPTVLPEGRVPVPISTPAQAKPDPQAGTPNATRAEPTGKPAKPARSEAKPSEGGPPPGKPQAARRRERRASPRRCYEQDVVAPSTQAARVLIGRDISLGGMRVGTHPDLSVGEELRIALHVRLREAPLVVRARVSRDDGEQGVLLEFHDLSKSDQTCLRRMLNFLPILAVREEKEEGAGIVISEILERRSTEARP